MKELAQDSGPSGSRRHGTEPMNWGNTDSGVRIHEAGQIRDHTESGIRQQQGPRDVEMQRRSTITDSRLSQQQIAPTQYHGEGNGPQRSQSSVYQLRPGQPDCKLYMKKGYCTQRQNCLSNHPHHLRPVCKRVVETGQCSYGCYCRFYHPTHIRLMKTVCEYFLKGTCNFGSNCQNLHPMEADGAEPIQHANTVQDPQESQRRRETELGEEGEIRGEDKEDLETKRKREEIEYQRRESRRKLEEVQRTVQFNDGKGVEEELAKLGGIRR